MGNLKDELATALARVADVLERMVDGKVDRTLSRLTVGFGGGSPANDDDYDAPDDAAARPRRGGKKKRRGKKKRARATSRAGKVGKKKRTRTVGANSEESREAIHKLLLRQGPLRVKEIVDITGISQGIVNKHLNILVGEKRSSTLRNGPRVLYRAVHDGRIGRKTAEKKKKSGSKKAEKTKESAPGAAAKPPVATAKPLTAVKSVAA